MIDTVMLRVSRDLPPGPARAQLGFRDIRRRLPCAATKLARAVRDVSVGRAAVKLTWSVSPIGTGWLTVQASLPKLLFGTNVRSMTTRAEVLRALDCLTRVVRKATKTDFDARRVILARVDYCANWHLGPGTVWAYITALRGGHIPRMGRTLYPTTVRFNNKSKTIVFYDKEAETHYRLRSGRANADKLPDSRGALRLEVRYQTPAACKALASELGLGKNFFPADLLTPAAASHALDGALRLTTLDRPVLGASDRLDALRELLGDGARFRRMEAFIKALHDEASDLFSKRLGVSRPTYHRNLNELRKVGLLLESPEPDGLPPLSPPQMRRRRAGPP